MDFVSVFTVWSVFWLPWHPGFEGEEDYAGPEEGVDNFGCVHSVWWSLPWN